MRKRYEIEELTCPECGFVAVNANGLRGHRQFKHGVRPSGAQLPLQKQDLLVSESKLEQLLDERLGVISEQLAELASPEQLYGVQATQLIAEQVNTQIKEQLKEQLGDLVDEHLELVQIDRGLTEAEKEYLAELGTKIDLLTQRVDKVVEQDNKNVRIVNDNCRDWGDKVHLLFQALDKHQHNSITGNATLDSRAAKLVDAEVGEADEQRGELPGAEKEPTTIQGKTSKPGYRYMEFLDLSVKE